MTAPQHSMGGTASPTVLVLGAHAFDAEVMAGALCATLAARGSRIVLAHLSAGEHGHVSLDPATYARQKRAEAVQAAQILGAEARFFNLPDTAIPVSADVASAVADLIREVRPDLAIGHWKGSWHKDHVAAHHALLHGVFLAALPTIRPEVAAFRPSRILFAENWEDGEDFSPDLYEDVTEGYDRWLAALDAYELGRAGLATFPYRDYYTSLARLRGCLLGVQYAEAFMPLGQETLAGLGIFKSSQSPSDLP